MWKNGLTDRQTDSQTDADNHSLMHQAARRIAGGDVEFYFRNGP